MKKTKVNTHEAITLLNLKCHVHLSVEFVDDSSEIRILSSALGASVFHVGQVPMEE